MDEKPGMFETTTKAIAFLLGLVAMMIFAMCALTSHFVESFFWMLGAVLIFRGLELGQFDED
jgi:hypothetical protein